jgi:3-dehydroquinate synthase
LAAIQVRVALAERAYDIDVSSGSLLRFSAFALPREKITHAIVITDRNVAAHAQVVSQSLTSAGVRVDLISISPGESMKSISSSDMLWNRFAELRADRKTVVVAVGGGVIGDLAGFIAATYTRGLRFFQVPTTLLSQVDSSVGGKVGVNLPIAKNMIGAFWQPRGVLIDTQTLNTLPQREYLSGLAEVVKYGVILDADFFRYLETHTNELLTKNATALAQVISRCCRLKADVVEKDEREETGLRAVLNYGHTFAHAFEACTAYGKLLHGEAVSIGMQCAARLALLLGRVDSTFLERQTNLLRTLELPLETPAIPESEILQAMQQDKKVEHGKLRFVLPTRMGHVELVHNIPAELVVQALKN